MSEALTVRSLAECEATIERGLATFIEVGQALAEIREARLYRESFETFEDYCQERWDFSRQRAHQLTQAAAVSNMLDTPPPNARVAAELVPLCDDPDQLREVWSEVNRNGGRPTAAAVKEIVQERADHSRPEPKYVYCPTCGSRVRGDKPRPPRGDT